MINTKLLLNNWSDQKAKNHHNEIEHLRNYAIILTFNA